MFEGYFERGGLRWGHSFWLGANATWPFATLSVTPDHAEVRVGIWPLQRRFVFDPGEVLSFRRRKGFFSVGVQIEHRQPEYPRFILFWTFHFHRLRDTVRAMGYKVESEPEA